MPFDDAAMLRDADGATRRHDKQDVLSAMMLIDAAYVAMSAARLYDAPCYAATFRARDMMMPAACHTLMRLLPRCVLHKRCRRRYADVASCCLFILRDMPVLHEFDAGIAR